MSTSSKSEEYLVSIPSQQGETWSGGYNPGIVIHRTSQDFKRKLLDLLLITLIGLVAFAVIVMTLISGDQQPLQEPIIQSSIFCVVVFTLAYFLNQNGHYFAAAWFTVLGLSLTSLVTSVLENDAEMADETLIYLLLPVIVSNLLLPLRSTIALLWFMILGVLLTVPVIDGFELQEAAFVALFLVISASVFLLHSHYQQNNWDRQQATLLKNEQRSIAVFRSIFDGIATYQQHSFIEYNTEFAHLFGYKSLQGVHSNKLLNLSPTLLQNLSWETPQIIQGTHRDGSTLYFEIVGDKRDRSKPNAYVMALQDITARKQAEASTRLQNDYRMATANIAIALVNRAELSELLNIILREAARLVDAEHGVIHLLHPKQQQPEAVVGLGIFANLREYWLPPDEELAGQGWDSKEAFIIDDYDQWPHRITNLPAGVCHAVACIPLKDNTTLLGTINLALSEKGRTFSQQEINTLNQLAELATIAIDNARLYAATQQEISERKKTEKILRQQNEYLTALHNTAVALMNRLDLSDVLAKILEYATHLVQAEHGLILLVDDKLDSLLIKSGIGFFATQNRLAVAKGEGLSGRVWQAQKPLVIEDYSQWDHRLELKGKLHAVVGIPLISENSVIGVLTLSHQQPARKFDEESIQQLTRFAELAVIAIDNAKLYTAAQQEIVERTRAEEALQKYNHAMTALHHVSIAITSAFQVDEILQKLTDAAQQVFPQSRMASVQLLDVAGKTMQTRAASPPMKNHLHLITFRPGYGVAGKAIASRQTINVRDIIDDPNYVRSDISPTYRSLLVAPLISGEKAWGTLSVTSKDIDAFTTQDEQLADMLARQAAVAIENANLYKSEHEQRILAEALKDTAAAVNSTLSLNEILDQILIQLARAIPYDGASVLLINNDGYARIVRQRGQLEKAPSPFIEEFKLKVDETPNLIIAKQTRRALVTPYVDQSEAWIKFPELEWIKSATLAPIITENDLIGFVSVDSDQPGFFNEETGERLQAFTDQVALAIHNAQLFSAERHQREIADTLQDIALALTSTLNRKEVLSRILAQVSRVLPYEAAGVWLYDENGLAQMVVGQGYDKFGIEEKAYELVINADETVCREMRESQQPIIVPVVKDSVLKPKGYEWLNSWAGAPIFNRGEMIGHLALDHSEPGFYKNEHRDVLTSLGNQLSVAVENASLLEKVQDHADQLEQRVIERTQELEHERVQLSAILDAMVEGVIYSEHNPVTNTREVRYVNTAFCQLTGYSVDETVGQSIFTIGQWLLGKQEFAAFSTGIRDEEMVESKETNVIWQRDTIAFRKDGTTFDANFIGHFERNPDDIVIWEVVLLRDISQAKALENQKTRFVANASHELRTPLTNIKTRVYLLRKQPEETERHLAVIDRTIDRMGNLVQDLLDVTRFERNAIPLQKEIVDLKSLVQDVLHDQQFEADKKHIRMHSQLGTEPIYLWADPHRIVQVITNLITNAISYTPSRGEIQAEIRIEDDHALLIIRDNGEGISEDELEHIFEPFFRAGTGTISGTGLGLTIAREIVGLHQGKIWAESVPDKGSTFYIKLPLAPADH